MLAPIIATMDSFADHLDPGTTDDDFLTWLASWVGLELDGGARPVDRRRLVANAVRLHRLRGTSEGLSAAVEMWFGVTPEIHESGAMGWSPDPETPLPGESTPHVTVVLRVDDTSAIDVEMVHRVVQALKPAHLSHDVNVVAG
jgi:P2-related tail formation protein